MAHVTISNALDYSEWRRFVFSQAAGNIFHTPEMYEVFDLACDYRPSLWIARNKDNVLALLMPVEITIAGGMLRRWTTRSVAYGSVLFDRSEAGEEGLGILLRSYVQGASGISLFHEMRNLDSMDSVQSILEGSGFVYHKHANILIDLNRPTNEIFNGIGRRTRKNIRHAINRKKVIVRDICDKNGLAECYALIKKTYDRARVPLAKYSLFEAAYDILYKRGMIKYTMAYIGENPVAASVELLYKDVVYGWYGGVDREYNSYSPGEILIWSILRWGAEKGYRIYDFGGAGNPEREYGVRRFKEKFGGKMVCNGRNMWVKYPLKYAISKVGYELYRFLVL